MFKNHMRSALRNLLKFKGFLIINLSGLSIGIACFLLIALYLKNELSYDKFNKKADRIVRLTLPNFMNTGKTLSLTPAKAAGFIKNQFAEVEDATRILTTRPTEINYKNKVFTEKKFIYADPGILNIFTFDFISGNKSNALKRLNTCIISESAAKKYFNNEDPIGKLIKINNSTDFEVTGLVKDFPAASELHFDFIGSIKTVPWVAKQEQGWENPANFYTYILLKDVNSINIFQSKLDNGVANMPEIKVKLEPLTSIHLHSVAEPNFEPFEPYGDYSHFISMLLIGLLILLIASINYMNLATAKSQVRSKEIGMRKMLGAERSQIVRQLYLESFIVVFCAVALAPFFAKLFLPLFNSISGRELALSQFGFQNLALLSAVIWIIVSLLSGSYPAIMLSSLKPIKMLQGNFETSKQGTIVRKALTVIQFCISFFLIAGTIIVYSQMNFISSKKLGFDKEHLLVVPVKNVDESTIKAFEIEINKNANIRNMALISDIPGSMSSGYSIQSVYTNDKNPLVTGVSAGPGIINTLGLNIIAGKDLPENYSLENGYLFILNESALGLLNLSPEDAINKNIDLNGRKGKICAVVKNFNYASLHNNIEPLVIFSQIDRSRQLLVRISGNDLKSTLTYINNTWDRLNISSPLNISFMDQEFDSLYKSEQKSSEMFTMLTVISIFVACLGLLGLAAYTLERRRKEIGVRKVLGATVSNLFVLLTKDFLILISVAIVLGLPLVEIVMKNWLDNFAYKIDIGIGLFVIAALVTLAVALITIGYQILKASNINPSKIIRYE